MFGGGGLVHSSDNGAFSGFITIVAAIQTTHTHCPTDRLIDTRIRTTGGFVRYRRPPFHPQGIRTMSGRDGRAR